MKIKQSILKGIITVLLIVITRIIDVFCIQGATEGLWLICGYLLHWIWDIEED